MDYLDYSETRTLFDEYTNKFSSSFSFEQKDLANEMRNKLVNLDEISKEVITLISNIFSIEDISPDENNTVNFMGISIKLQPADPNIPIKLDNVLKSYSKGEETFFSTKETKKMESRLERLANEFYQVAHRISHITEGLPNLESFKVPIIRTIRNQLIEHPEEKSSGITHDSFSYSKNEGPYIKGLRKNGQTKHMDEGFKKNNNTFIIKLTDTLKSALALSHEN